MIRLWKKFFSFVNSFLSISFSFHCLYLCHRICLVHRYFRYSMKCSGTSLSFFAAVFASLLRLTPSLVRMWLTWVLTVGNLISIICAISALLLSAQISRSTCITFHRYSRCYPFYVRRAQDRPCRFHPHLSRSRQRQP